MRTSSQLRRVSSNQIIEARQLLCWTAVELAKHSRITHASMIRLECQISLPRVKLQTLSAVISTLESSGIVFYENEVILNANDLIQ